MPTTNMVRVYTLVTNIVAQWVKLLPVVPTSYIRALISVLAALLAIQLPADVTQRRVKERSPEMCRSQYDQNHK